MRAVAFPLVLLALWAQASALAPAIADEPAAQPSADLQVPTIEALRAPNARPSSGPDRVGDVVTFKMPGLQGEEFKFSASEGNPMDQGWQFAEEAKPDANVMASVRVIVLPLPETELPAPAMLHWLFETEPEPGSTMPA